MHGSNGTCREAHDANLICIQIPITRILTNHFHSLIGISKGQILVGHFAAPLCDRGILSMKLFYTFLFANLNQRHIYTQELFYVFWSTTVFHQHRIRAILQYKHGYALLNKLLSGKLSLCTNRQHAEATAGADDHGRAVRFLWQINFHRRLHDIENNGIRGTCERHFLMLPVL